MEQEETNDNKEINSLTDLLNGKVFNVMFWQEGMGWAISDAELTIEDARVIKNRYLQVNRQSRIFLEVE